MIYSSSGGQLNNLLNRGEKTKKKFGSGKTWASSKVHSLVATGAIHGAETYPQNRLSTLGNTCEVQTKLWSGFAAPLKLESPAFSG